MGFGLRDCDRTGARWARREMDPTDMTASDGQEMVRQPEVHPPKSECRR
jgi:hypothetical protein